MPFCRLITLYTGLRHMVYMDYIWFYIYIYSYMNIYIVLDIYVAYIANNNLFLTNLLNIA